jgi:riboflavin kinase/FMN adenylyltransferase
MSFTPRLGQMSAEEFVEKVFVESLGIREVVIGHDHAFGQGRRGGLKTLETLGEQHGFNVVAIDPILLEGAPISSTRIRACLLSGRVGEAARMLGRPYHLNGSVVAGKGRGRSLQYPTANLDVDAEKLIPGDGVYAVLSCWKKTKLHGLINIGRRPTFGDGSRTLEIHFFDFEESLYGQKIQIQLIEKIRDERRFTDTGQLKEQIGRDEQVARRILATR